MAARASEEHQAEGQEVTKNIRESKSVRYWPIDDRDAWEELSKEYDKYLDACEDEGLDGFASLHSWWVNSMPYGPLG
jgi:hypothetical protein